MKKILYIIGSVIGVFLYTVTVVRFGAYIRDIDITPDVAADAAQHYTVKEVDGEIWVFSPDSRTPERRLNINYDSLRKVDKVLFSEGITIQTLEEILEIEEDFSS